MIDDPTNPGTSAWVSANAGAGKTQMLANRVTRLLLAGSSPDRILCLTFTKAAAAEMSARLFRDLGRWSLLEDDVLQAEMAKIGEVSLTPEQLRRARTLFAQALETPGGLKIQTIHAFCQMLLSRFPLEAGVPPRFQVLDDRSADEIMRMARNAVLARAASEPRLRDAAAVLAARADDVRFGDLLNLGINSGRGKIADLVAQHGGEQAFLRHLRGQIGAPDESEEVLLAGFCRDLGADGPICKRAAQWLLAGSPKDEPLGRLLSAFHAGGMGPDAVRHLHDIFFTKDGPRKSLATKATKDKGPDLIVWLERLRDAYSTLYEKLRPARVMRATEAVVILSLAVMEEYARLKAARTALDYDDLIFGARDLLLQSEMAAWVLYKLDNGIDHILVDEAQDTSREQWRIVQQLAGEFFAGTGAHEDRMPTIFAVGDEKQSIFGFQGAAPKEFGVNRTHFRGLAERAGMPFVDAHPPISRRSGDKILEFVDAVFAQDIARKGLTYENETVHHSGDRKIAGRVDVWPTVPVPDDVDVDLWGTDEAAPRRGSHFRLARGIARWIRTLLDSGARIPSTGKPVTPGSIMILVRRRNAFATEMIRQLLEHQVAVAGADRMVLTEQMAIQDLVALGRFALLPEDDLNLAALLKAPFIDLIEDDLFALAYGRGKQHLWNVLLERRNERPSFARAHSFLLGALAAAGRAPPFEFYARILGNGVRRIIIARLGDEASDAIDEFLALALAHEGTHAPSLESFLDWFEKGASDVKRDMERGSGAVRVMTVHGAKGLDSDIVIVPDTTQIPDQERRQSLLYADDCVFFNVAQPLAVPAITDAKTWLQEREMEEYRRLLYVALTRARDWLIVAGYEMKQHTVHPLSWYQAVHNAVLEMGATPDANGVLGLGDPIEFAPLEQPVAEVTAGLPEFLSAPAPKEDPRPRILRPSDAAGEEEPALLSPLADNGKRFRRGLLIHALLAALPNVPAEKRDEAARKYLEREGIAADEADAIAKEAFAVLTHPDFAPLFGPDSRGEVPIVADLPEIGPGVRTSGQIDRLAVTGDSVLVADFKTNRPPPATADKTPAYYRAQMALYREALKKIYPGKRISCALIWTENTRLMPLDDALLDAELAKITRRVLENPVAA